MVHCVVKSLTVIGLSLAINTFAAEPTGWDPEHAFEVDPCVWVIARVNDSLGGYADDGEEELGLAAAANPAADVIEALENDGQMQRLADSIDLQAKRLLGMAASDVTAKPVEDMGLVLNKDVPSFDRIRERWTRNRKKHAFKLALAYRDMVDSVDRNPDSPAFYFIQSAMLERRISELRYSKEASDPTALALFRGNPVSKVHIVGGLAKIPQLATPETFLKDRRAQEPVLSLVWDLAPMFPGPLAQISSVVRESSFREGNPLANEGKLHFNSDSFRYTGMLEIENNWDCVDSPEILGVADSALSYPGRNRVSFEVPLTHLYIVEAAFELRSPRQLYLADMAHYLGGVLPLVLLEKPELSTEEDEFQKGIRDTLMEVAIALTQDRRIFTHTGNQPSDIMGEPTVISPEDPAASAYRFIFRRRDGKSIEINFTGPQDLHRHALEKMGD